ncbi:hypothetical protein WJX84_001053 [Apatococcus fuscideae]|uniref:Uncharacterized protein n=1 Tax=Apatococcus fuscideae TaxID=2026836 RepID=A0AAW1TCR8_9CHLO
MLVNTSSQRKRSSGSFSYNTRREARPQAAAGLLLWKSNNCGHRIHTLTQANTTLSRCQCRPAFIASTSISNAAMPGTRLDLMRSVTS